MLGPDTDAQDQPPPFTQNSACNARPVRKCRRFQIMSALPHKADINSRDCDVRLVPGTDLATQTDRLSRPEGDIGNASRKSFRGVGGGPARSSFGEAATDEGGEKA